MDKKMLSILKKLYKYDNTDYDSSRGLSLYRTDTLTSDERKLLDKSSWEPNEIEFITHDEINRKLIALRSDEHLTWQPIAGAFIAGVGGSYPRGISSLMSYHRMIHMHEHSYEQAERFICCKYCGHHKDQWDHLSRIRYAIHSGNTYGNNPTGAYTDMAEMSRLLAQAPIIPTTEDVRIFNQLIQFIEAAEDDLTPGQFEKHLTASKLIKGTAGLRRGILQSLAFVGVLPNISLTLSPDLWTNVEDILNAELNLNNTKGRSDMEMPWAGWQGKCGVDQRRLQQLFGPFLAG